MRFLSQVEGFRFPYGFLNKQVTGCGATSLALEDETMDTVVYAPRISLLRNKHEQYPNERYEGETLMMFGDTKDHDVAEYLRSHTRRKILCTYDSAKRLKRLLGIEWQGFLHFVDEAHALLEDSGFKSDVVMKFIDTIKTAEKLCFVTATPHIDDFLQHIPFLKELPYTQLDWEEKERYKVMRCHSENPVNSALRLVRNYRRGIYISKTIDGKTVEATELVLFLNSVNNLVNIVRQADLSAEDVNIIVADQKQNQDVIKLLGEDYAVGRVPLKGERNKRITLCTSTAYYGCDFWSDSAMTVVVSKCKGRQHHMTVDVSTQLVQIAGRQRNLENPFRSEIMFIYDDFNGTERIDEIMEQKDEKIKLTEQMNAFLNTAPEHLRPAFRRIVAESAKATHYAISYSYFNDKTDRFEQNDWACLFERYQARVQYETFRSGVMVLREL